jgi:excisionase family DNA binding protein
MSQESTDQSLFSPRLPLPAIPSVPSPPIAERFIIELMQSAAAPSIEKLAYRYDEAADALSLSMSTIKRLISSGDLQAISFGRARRVTRESIDRMLQKKQ